MAKISFSFTGTSAGWDGGAGAGGTAGKWPSSSMKPRARKIATSSNTCSGGSWPSRAIDSGVRRPLIRLRILPSRALRGRWRRTLILLESSTNRRSFFSRISRIWSSGGASRSRCSFSSARGNGFLPQGRLPASRVLILKLSAGHSSSAWISRESCSEKTLRTWLASSLSSAMSASSICQGLASLAVAFLRSDGAINLFINSKAPYFSVISVLSMWRISSPLMSMLFQESP